MARSRLGRADLAEGGFRAVDVGQRLVLVSRVGGAFWAISDWCNHAGCRLSQGSFEATSVTCHCHGATFDRRTGKNLNAPHLCGDQDAYEVREESGELFVEWKD